MKIKIFESITTFFNFLEGHGMLQSYTEFEIFVDAYNRINVGCGCQKAKRIRDAEEAYGLLAGMMGANLAIAEDIKSKEGLSEIQMYLNGEVIFKG